jgi:hypothetical protein
MVTDSPSSQRIEMTKSALYARQLKLTNTWSPRSQSVHPQSDIARSPKHITDLILFITIMLGREQMRWLVDWYIILPQFRRTTSWERTILS